MHRRGAGLCAAGAKRGKSISDQWDMLWFSITTFKRVTSLETITTMYEFCSHTICQKLYNTGSQKKKTLKSSVRRVLHEQLFMLLPSSFSINEWKSSRISEAQNVRAKGIRHRSLAGNVHVGLFKAVDVAGIDVVIVIIILCILRIRMQLEGREKR